MSVIHDVIKKLNAEQISYVVVGGVAVVLHGRDRLTLDLDVVIALDDANIRKTIEIMGEFGLKPRIPVDPFEFADPNVRRQWVEERGMKVFSFSDPKGSRPGVDIFPEYPIDYQELLAHSQVANLGDTPVRICSLEHLIKLKRLANRRHDLDDIEVLELIRDAKQKTP